jgi:hypothetical protein
MIWDTPDAGSATKYKRCMRVRTENEKKPNHWKTVRMKNRQTSESNARLDFKNLLVTRVRILTHF